MSQVPTNVGGYQSPPVNPISGMAAPVNPALQPPVQSPVAAPVAPNAAAPVSPVATPPNAAGQPTNVLGATRVQVDAQGQPVQPEDIDPATGKKRRKQRAPRAPYRQIVNAETGEVSTGDPLTGVPENWSSKLHQPLSKTDFADEAFFYDFKASQSQKAANKFARLAAEARAGGTPEQRAATKKLGKLMEEMASQEANLKAMFGPEKYAEMVARMQAGIAGAGSPMPAQG